ncbi:RND family transporter [Oceaniserpentilla sp. 4NH20-0058]|uniref:efflux RND transporter permease subunit n=1 Tax=Oceaniserpentilla sp. 4NH20-0058 TaxID=3127660 RepID=UPI003108BEF3
MLRLVQLYQNTILARPKSALIVILLLILAVFQGAKHFELDASAESLVLENDQDLINYRDVAETFGSSEFLIVTYTPPWPLFSEASLSLLKEIRDELKVLPRVESIYSLLDVPLLENPPVPVTDLVNNIKTLEHPDVDVEAAKQELANSPIYNNMLLNLEQNTTAIQINRPFNDRHRALTKAREDIWKKQEIDHLSAQDLQKLNELEHSIKELNAENAAVLHKDIIKIRQVIAPYKSQAEIYLGGVPMIADDMITYVESDLFTFGMGVFLFLIVTLMLIFRRVRWVIISLGCCAITVAVMIGVLGLFNWRVTVISSNFVSLLLIMSMSMCIHLIVRYREAHSEHPDASQLDLVKETIGHIFKPCLYMALTTMVAFNSLIFSGIRPVIDFGWMMATGVFVALAIVFVLFPIFALLAGKRTESGNVNNHSPITDLFLWVTLKHGRKLIFASIGLFALVVLGLAQLKVENSFINYFKQSTEIYQGMEVIDQRLGGTTPLEVVLQFPVVNQDWQEEENDDFFFDEQEPEDPTKYWFTTEKINRIKQVHAYLDAQPEIGKVLSLATMVEVAEKIHGSELGSFELALLYSAIPEEFKSIVITPYVSPENGQARISLRIYDSLPDLKRAELLQRIETDLQAKLELKPDDYMLAGMMVLYNNMLQSLFTSQILTLGAVFVGIMFMFILLFGSWKMALIAIVPNLLSAGVVLSVMGWAGIPLDMMTITIAAITIGIAVDDTIHYIHRFKEEFDVVGQYQQAVINCHASIGKAVYYTSLTVIVGFSILALSNFIPTIYFGLLTGLAMLIALILVLTLLPRLLIIFKPLGAESKP